MNKVVRPLALFAFLSACGFADASVEETDDSISYAFSSLLGTGYYEVKGDKLFLMTLPLSWQTESMAEGNRPWTLLLPVSVSLTRINELIESLPKTTYLEALDEEVRALTFAPGVEWSIPLHYDWLVKPYVQAGMAWDAAARQSSYLCFVGATARRSWDLDGHRLTWGNGLSGAYQEVRHGNDRSSLLMLQTGVDYEFDEWFRLVGHEVTPSLFVLGQHFSDALQTERTQVERVPVENMLHLGFTVGFREERSLMGIPYQRVGLSLVRGSNNLKAVSLNLGFWL